MGAAQGPVPAIAAAAEPFTVRDQPLADGGSSAQPAGGSPGVFCAPLAAADPESLGVRQHEYGHLAVEHLGIVPPGVLETLSGWSRIHECWVQAALDVLVNAYMLARGNPEIAALQPVMGPVPADPPKWLAASAWLRCERLACGPQLRNALAGAAGLDAADMFLLETIAGRLAAAGECARPVTLSGLRRDLRELQRRFGPGPFERGAARGFPQFGTVRGRRVAAEGAGARVPGRVLHNEWGALETLTPPLTVRAPGPWHAARRRPARSGPLLYPHRAILPSSDGRAFGIRDRRRHGALLIDCSGSMHVKPEDLARVVAAAPQVVIGAYASLPGDLSAGRLVVVGREGCLLDGLDRLRDLFGTGNVVDGPALAWLAAQPAPRVWISDGRTTGRADVAADNLSAEAGATLQAAAIRRVNSLREYLRR